MDETADRKLVDEARQRGRAVATSIVFVGLADIDGKTVVRASHGDSMCVVKSIDDLSRYLVECGQTSIYCSSTIDFPEDETEDPEVIALCEAIRDVDNPKV